MNLCFSVSIETQQQSESYNDVLYSTTPGLCLYTLKAEILSSQFTGRKGGIPPSIPDLLIVYHYYELLYLLKGTRAI